MLPALAITVKLLPRLYLQYLLTQVEKHPIEVRLNTTATREMVAEMEPDAIFVAVGANPVQPPIPGIDGDNVMGFYEALTNRSAIG